MIQRSSVPSPVCRLPAAVVFSRQSSVSPGPFTVVPHRQRQTPAPRSGVRRWPAAAGGDRPEPDQPADDDVDREAPQLLPADPPVRVATCAAASFGELADDLFTPRQRRDHRPRVPLRDHQQSPGGRSSLDAQQDDPDFGRWDALRQGDSLPVSVSLTGSFEGLNNLREQYQPGVAVTVSRTFGDRLALYATPAFVADTHAVDFIAGHEDTITTSD